MIGRGRRLRGIAALTTVVVPLLTLAALTGCASPHRGGYSALLRIDACEAYQAYDSLSQPKLTRPDRVRIYADAVLHITSAVDPRLKAADRPVPSAVATAIASLRQSTRRFVDNLRTASGAGGLRSALSAYASDPQVATSDAVWEDFAVRVCERLR
jgi:hypothetical protein